jgi:hypothetical protein
MLKTSKCFNCEEFGHESRDCTKRCGICQSTQHKSGYHLNDHLYEQVPPSPRRPERTPHTLIVAC